jgi:hypothetical protein
VLAIGWWKEIASLLVAVLALIAIALILSMYNGHEQPAWKYSPNLSNLTAILSTLYVLQWLLLPRKVWHRSPLLACRLPTDQSVLSCEPTEVALVSPSVASPPSRIFRSSLSWTLGLRTSSFQNSENVCHLLYHPGASLTTFSK